MIPGPRKTKSVRENVYPFKKVIPARILVAADKVSRVSKTGTAEDLEAQVVLEVRVISIAVAISAVAAATEETAVEQVVDPFVVKKN